MSKTDNLTDFLTGVANAIRTKKGTTAKINPQNFETEISSITTSKPEQEKTVEATNSRQTILPDNGKTLSKVIIAAAPLPSVNNPTYQNINKCLIDTRNKILILGCDDSVIPSDGSVTSIGEDAFDGCSGLTNITIPDSVTSIGDDVFWDCSGLTSVTLGNSVTSISRGAFYGCRGLTSVTIPDSVTFIGLAAFRHCTGLTSVTIGKAVTRIDENAFYNCSSLTSVTIPDSVTVINNAAFHECSQLTSVTIGKAVTHIGGGVFFSCDSLTSVTMLPSNPPTLGSDAIPSNVTTITVPVGCGDAYKTAAGWSAYADKIVEAAA